MKSNETIGYTDKYQLEKTDFFQETTNVDEKNIHEKDSTKW